jgi:hypothetical protein
MREPHPPTKAEARGLARDALALYDRIVEIGPNKGNNLVDSVD